MLVSNSLGTRLIKSMFATKTLRVSGKLVKEFHHFSTARLSACNRSFQQRMASSKWEELGVVPEIIDKAPPLKADVVYPSGVSCDFGNELTPTQVKDMPRITFPGEEGALYTIIMTDYDTPEVVREVHHFMMINVTGGDSKNGTVHSEYIGSGAPEGTGIHRYCFLIYKQPAGFQPADAYRPRTRERRVRFSLRRYVAENNLGDPVAGNFFRAQFDDWVPKQKAELDAATTTKNLDFFS